MKETTPYGKCSGCSPGGDGTHQEGTVEHPLPHSPEAFARVVMAFSKAYIHVGEKDCIFGDKVLAHNLVDAINSAHTNSMREKDARILELEGALDKYGQHHFGCQTAGRSDGMNDGD